MISQEKAYQLLDEWLKAFDTEMVGPDREKIALAIGSERLTYDPGSQLFTIILNVPIQLENGEEIIHLDIAEPTVDQLKNASRVKDEFMMSLKLLSQISKQPEAILSRMKMRDMTLASLVLGFFS